MSLRSNTHVLALLTLLSANSLLGKQLVLPEGDEDHNIPCQAPDAVNYVIIWAVDGAVIEDELMGFQVGDQQTVADGIKERNVTFIPTADVHNMTLTCVITDVLNVENPSPPQKHIVIIQGILPAPVVDYYKRDQSVLFKWNAPFSHDITGVERDISHYVVNIINMADHSVLSDNTTHTEYLLEPEQCQFNEYQVEIAAVNIVGVGEKYTSPQLTLQKLSLSDRPSIDLSEEFPVINFKVDTSCEENINFDFAIVAVNSEEQTNINDVSSEDKLTLTLSSNELKFNEHYVVTVTVDAAPNFSHTLFLSTHDVQRVETTLTDNEFYQITCFFANGAKARGCRIVLTQTPEEGGGECELSATRQDGVNEATVSVQLPAGEYSLLVYDDDDDDDDDDDEDDDQTTPAYTGSITSTTSNIHDTDCFPDDDSKTDPTDNTNFKKEEAVGLALGISIVIIALLAVVVLTVVLCVRKCKIDSQKPRPLQHENGDIAKESNDYIDTESFLRTASSQPQTQTNGAFEPSPSAQQVNPERVGETQLFQHSHHHNGVATSHQLEPPPPLHNVQPSPATHTHHSSLYSEGSSVSEANSWELSPRSTTSNTPLIPRESNYIEVQPTVRQGLQSPPCTDDSVQYARIVPQASSPHQNPQANPTDETPQ